MNNTFLTSQTGTAAHSNISYVTTINTALNTATSTAHKNDHVASSESINYRQINDATTTPETTMLSQEYTPETNLGLYSSSNIHIYPGASVNHPQSGTISTYWENTLASSHSQSEDTTPGKTSSDSVSHSQITTESQSGSVESGAHFTSSSASNDPDSQIEITTFSESTTPYQSVSIKPNESASQTEGTTQLQGVAFTTNWDGSLVNSVSQPDITPTSTGNYRDTDFLRNDSVSQSIHSLQLETTSETHGTTSDINSDNNSHHNNNIITTVTTPINTTNRTDIDNTMNIGYNNNNNGNFNYYNKLYNLCYCQCPDRVREISQMLHELNISDKMTQIERHLNLEHGKLSAAIRRHRSISDFRLMSSLISMPTILTCLIVFSFVLISDVVKSFRLRQSFKFNARN